QVSGLALVLILTPLLWLGRQRPQAPAAALPRWRIALYFLAIGFPFLFVEIASLQPFFLFLGHPVYAIGICRGPLDSDCALPCRCREASLTATSACAAISAKAASNSAGSRTPNW